MAKEAVKDFEKILDYCQSMRCRHTLFTKHFGDAPPSKCTMCDVCTNKKQAEKNLEGYQKLTAQAAFHGFIEKPDKDPIDCYEGKFKFDYNLKENLIFVQQVGVVVTLRKAHLMIMKMMTVRDRHRSAKLVK